MAKIANMTRRNVQPMGGDAIRNYRAEHDYSRAELNLGGLK